MLTCLSGTARRLTSRVPTRPRAPQSSRGGANNNWSFEYHGRVRHMGQCSSRRLPRPIKRTAHIHILTRMPSIASQSNARPGDAWRATAVARVGCGRARLRGRCGVGACASSCGRRRPCDCAKSVVGGPKTGTHYGPGPDGAGANKGWRHGQNAKRHGGPAAVHVMTLG